MSTRSIIREELHELLSHSLSRPVSRQWLDIIAARAADRIDTGPREVDFGEQIGDLLHRFLGASFGYSWSDALVLWAARMMIGENCDKALRAMVYEAEAKWTASGRQ